MWNPFSFFYRIFFPKISLWGLMKPFVLPIIGTLLFFTIFTLTFRYLVRPYLLMLRYKNVKGAWMNYIPFLGSIWKFKMDEKKHGDFHFSSKRRIQEHPETRFLVSPFKDKVMVLLYDPELVKEFLSKEDSFTYKDPRKANIFHKSVKQGISFATGEQWKSQREFITGVFNQQFVENFIPTVQNTAKEWIGHNFKEESAVVDMAKKVRWFTAKIGGKIFFGEHAYSTPDEFKTFMNASIENQRLWTEIRESPLRHIFGSKIHKLGLRSIDRQYKRQVKMINRWYQDILQKFKKSLEERKGTEDSKTKTLLEFILEQNTKSPENERMSDESIIGQMMTFFSAETSATAAFLTSALYFLASHRSIQKRLRHEINESYKTNELSFEMLSNMEYLNGFIKETFRMQTPTSLLYQRKVKQNTALLDVKLHKGDRVNVDILSMGYNPKLFTNPTSFYPERWIEKTDPGVNERFAHLPFSEGAHKCPGKQLAIAESMIMLCELLKKFDISLEKQGHVNLGFDFVYHIKGPLNVTLTKV